MKVLSLFDGISCGMVALERAGIPVDVYYASEIEPSTITISRKNYPTIVQLGDVTKWREWDIPWEEIDLVLGGSPCQGFSFAGKQLNFDDPRSKLFFVFADILNHVKCHNPAVKFLLENVKMKKQSEDVITDKLGVAPVRINSERFSAQSRNRLYWFNWFVEVPTQVNALVLKDVMLPLSDVDQEYFHTRTVEQITTQRFTQGRKMIQDESRKCECLLARDFKDPKSVVQDGVLRRLTPIEYERLQTLPDNYTSGVRKSHRYQALGNGWTVDVIAYILRGLSVGEEQFDTRKKVAVRRVRRRGVI